MVGTENRERLARHVDSTSDKGRVFFGDLDCRCRELKCGFVGRYAERHVNEGSDRLMAKRPLPRQLVSEGFANQETSVTARNPTLCSVLGYSFNNTFACPKYSRVLGK